MNIKSLLLFLPLTHICMHTMEPAQPFAKKVTPEEKALALFAQELRSDNADIILLSVGSRGYEWQEVPFFMKELARQFKNRQIRIYSISEEQNNSSSLSLRAKEEKKLQGHYATLPENQSFYCISQENDLIERYKHPVIQNLEVISLKTGIPLRGSQQESAHEFCTALREFLGRKLNHGQVVFIGNNSAYTFNDCSSVAAIAHEYLSNTSSINKNNLQLYMQCGASKNYASQFWAYQTVVPTTVPQYEGQFIRPENNYLRFTCFNGQGFLQDDTTIEPIRYHITETANNTLAVTTITGPFEALNLKESPFLKPMMDKGQIRPIAQQIKPQPLKVQTPTTTSVEHQQIIQPSTQRNVFAVLKNLWSSPRVRIAVAAAAVVGFAAWRIFRH